MLRFTAMLLLVLSLLSGLLIGVLGITYKLASRQKLDADEFRSALTWIAAIFAGAGMLLAGEPVMDAAAVAGGILCGVCFFLALIGVMRAMELGPVSFSWVLINLSIVIPILASAALWGESVRGMQWLGMAFFAVSLALFGRDLSASAERRISPAWLGAAVLMFLANGTFLLLFKVIDQNTTQPHTFVTLCTLYVTSALLFAARRRKLAVPRLREARLAAVAAACMMGGQALIMKAQAIDTAAALPIIHGVSIIVVAAASVPLFAERFSRYSMAGLAAGIVSIVLLTAR